MTPFPFTFHRFYTGTLKTLGHLTPTIYGLFRKKFRCRQKTESFSRDFCEKYDCQKHYLSCFVTRQRNSFIIKFFRQSSHVISHLSRPDSTGLGCVRFSDVLTRNRPRTFCWSLENLISRIIFTETFDTPWNLVCQIRLSHYTAYTQKQTNPGTTHGNVKLETPVIFDSHRSSQYTHEVRLYQLGVIFGTCGSESLGEINCCENYNTVCSTTLLIRDRHVKVTLSCLPLNTDQRGNEVRRLEKKKRLKFNIIEKHYLTLEVVLLKRLKTLRLTQLFRLPLEPLGVVFVFTSTHPSTQTFNLMGLIVTFCKNATFVLTQRYNTKETLLIEFLSKINLTLTFNNEQKPLCIKTNSPSNLLGLSLWMIDLLP